MRKLTAVFLSAAILFTGCGDVHTNSDGSVTASGYKSQKITSAYVLTDDGVICQLTDNKLDEFKSILKGGFHAVSPNDDVVYHEIDSDNHKYKHYDYSHIVMPYFWATKDENMDLELTKEYKEYLKAVRDVKPEWYFDSAPYRLVSFDKNKKNIDIGTFRFDDYTNVFFGRYVVDDDEISKFISDIDLSVKPKSLDSYKLAESDLPEEEVFDETKSVIRQLTVDDVYDDNGESLSDEEIQKNIERKLKEPVQTESDEVEHDTTVDER